MITRYSLSTFSDHGLRTIQALLNAIMRQVCDNAAMKRCPAQYQKKYMYGKGDYEKLRKMMSSPDWEEQLDGKTVETGMDNRQITDRCSSSQLHTKED